MPWRTEISAAPRVGVVTEVDVRVDEVLGELIHEVDDVGVTLLLDLIA